MTPEQLKYLCEYYLVILPKQMMKRAGNQRLVKWDGTNVSNKEKKDADDSKRKKRTNG